MSGPAVLTTRTASALDQPKSHALRRGFWAQRRRAADALRWRVFADEDEDEPTLTPYTLHPKPSPKALETLAAGPGGRY
jgi:hypothetical protein